MIPWSVHAGCLTTSNKIFLQEAVKGVLRECFHEQRLLPSFLLRVDCQPDYR